jgi:HK97 gp10 family phage protein
MSPKIRIDGLKEVQAALRKLPDSTAKNVIRRVLKKRAQPVADDAQARAPVARGHLRRSVAVTTKLTKRQRSQHRKLGKGDVEMFIGAGPDPAAHMQEYGTSKEPPQPFMRPAWDGGWYRLLMGVKEDMWSEIRKSSKRLMRKAARAAGKAKG